MRGHRLATEERLETFVGHLPLPTRRPEPNRPRLRWRSERVSSFTSLQNGQRESPEALDHSRPAAVVNPYPATTADCAPDCAEATCRQVVVAQSTANCEGDCSGSSESVPHSPHRSYGKANHGDATPILSRKRTPSRVRAAPFWRKRELSTTWMSGE